MRSVAGIAAATLEEVLDSQEESANVLLSTTPWRRHCRRLVSQVLAD